MVWDVCRGGYGVPDALRLSTDGGRDGWDGRSLDLYRQSTLISTDEPTEGGSRWTDRRFDRDLANGPGGHVDRGASPRTLSGEGAWTETGGTGQILGVGGRTDGCNGAGRFETPDSVHPRSPLEPLSRVPRNPRPYRGLGTRIVGRKWEGDEG